MLRKLSTRLFTQMQNLIAESTKLLNHMYGIEDMDDDNVVITEKIKSIPYEEKYLERYKQLSLMEIIPDKNKFVIENTPIGNVVMQYDSNKESFVYYSDHIVPFRFLEAVSMKYVCIFNCKQIYVERHEEIIPIQATQPKTTKEMLIQARNPTVNKKEQIEVKMNRYSNAGRFSNFNILQPIAKHITDKKQLMKFSDFKTTFITK